MITTTIEATSSLYFHPSDGNIFMVVEKLQGYANYTSWKRSMEIGLTSKRKLGFVTDLITRDEKGTITGEA